MGVHSKSGRVLELYRMLLTGKTIHAQETAEYYGVNLRSIRRDIEAIREFLADQCMERGIRQSVEYDAKEKGYRLVTQELSYLSEGEMLAVCKILLESRAFSKEMITSLLQRILNLCVSDRDQEEVERYCSNELFYYMTPAHASPNLDFLWKSAKAIREQQVIEITYVRMKGQATVTRQLKPVGILFSEYYFYLMGVIADTEIHKGFEKENDLFPTIYRLDRIRELTVTEEHFSLAYRERFKEGDYKNRVQYMYGGEPSQVTFRYAGPSIEAVLDRLPMARITENENGSYTVKAEVFGDGILMWLLSQGSKVEVIAPESLKERWLNEAGKILKREVGEL